MSKLHQKIIEVTKRIAKRSLSSRQKYLNNITSMEQNNDTDRNFVSCSNMAHAAAAACAMFCLLYTSPSPRDATLSRMPSSA